ncbi:MAG: AtpZ/AtpI family protein [bacterium]|nr:AtpZ/AtpI family protein [bacterium]
MEKITKREPWWKPALTVFGEVLGWIVVPLLLALIVGKKLDTHFGTAPWIFLGATAVGFAVSSFGIVRTAFTYILNIKNEDGKSTESKS